ncbi:hypothetical protein Tco_0122260 [Tanacetum coccineum]
MMTEGKRIGRYHTHRLIAERHLTDHSFFRFIIRQAIIDFHSDASSDPSSRLIVRSFFTRFTEYFCGAISQETILVIWRGRGDPNALRDRGIEARVVVEAIDRDETETGVRGPVEVRVEGGFKPHPVRPVRFHDHTQAIPDHRIQAIEGVQREQGHRIVGVESAVIALTERIAELERGDNRVLKAHECEEKMPNTLSGASMSCEEFEELVTRRVAE